MHDTVTRVARIVVATLLVSAVAMMAVLAVPSVIGAKSSLVVLSGSMQPHLQPGDVVVLEEANPSEIQAGEVITFRTDSEIGDAGHDRVTHRVVEKRQTDEGVVYRTKGDANDQPDPGVVHQQAVVGTVWFHVPLVGRLLLILQRPLAQMLMTVVPGVLLVVSGVWTIAGELTAGGK